jgi:multicomponent K+:H+ antiporter subunit E
MIRRFARRISAMLVLALALLWLALNESFSPGHIALGLLLGVLMAWASSTLRPLHARLRRVDLALHLLLLVLADMVRANLHVAGIVLGLTGKRRITPGLLNVPLQLQDPHGLAVLAMIVTATPGTVWVGTSPDGNWLQLHVLDLRDEPAMVRMVKERYERRLMRIFG